MPIVPVDQVSEKSFDYVVVGGGTAGLVVATRLTEDPSVSVLVLEAGDANLDDPAILTPAAFGSHFGKPQYDWGFNTVPQRHAGGNATYWPRGKGLGGSSAINFLLYHLPAKSDIDAFGKLGNKGWNWDMLKEYYHRVEKFLPPQTQTDQMKFDLKEHGTEGPLEIGYPLVLSGLEKPYVEALGKYGINVSLEPFSGNNNGTWLSPISVHPVKRVRSYAANMYYEPNASRSNLVVLTSAHVAKLLLSKQSDEGETATGVSFLHGGKEFKAFAKKEVVLSAGAIMSPQILELSGIGDPQVLQKAGVKPVVDLRGVGNNVQEHIYTGSSYQVKEEHEDDYLTFDCLSDPEELAKQKELFLTGKGAFGMSLSCLAFVPLSALSSEAQALRDNLISTIRTGIDAGRYPPGLQRQHQVQLEHIEEKQPSCELILAQSISVKCNTRKPKRKYVTMTALQNHPISRGTIHIASNDPLEHPVIDPHYFEEDYDLKAFIETFKFNRRLVQQEPLKSILVAEEVFPGPSVQTDEQIADFLKRNFMTTYHTVGSCSMLPRNDAGVVDNKLKVYGTTNVRVIDISIIPLHIGAHMQATAYAIGELGADIIKGLVDF